MDELQAGTRTVTKANGFVVRRANNCKAELHDNTANTYQGLTDKIGAWLYI